MFEESYSFPPSVACDGECAPLLRMSTSQWTIVCKACVYALPKWHFTFFQVIHLVRGFAQQTGELRFQIRPPFFQHFDAASIWVNVVVGFPRLGQLFDHDTSRAEVFSHRSNHVLVSVSHTDQVLPRNSKCYSNNSFLENRNCTDFVI